MTVVRPFVAWLPPLLMIVLGSLYMFNCAQALLAPGRGFVYQYRASGGIVTVEAQSYAIDPGSLSLAFNDIRITSSKTGEAASANRAFVQMRGNVVTARVMQAQASLFKQSDGIISAFELIPEPKEGQEPATIRLQIDELNVDYRDDSQSPKLWQTVKLRDIKLDSSKSGAIASISAQFPNAGGLVAKVIIPTDGDLEVQTSTPRLDLAGLLPLTKSFLTPDQLRLIKPYSAGSAWVNGKASVILPIEGEPTFSANLKLNATNVNAPDWLNGATISGDFIADNNFISASLTSREKNRQIDFDGGIDLKKEIQVIGDFKVALNDKSAIWKPVQSLVPKEASFKNLVYSGTAVVKGEKLQDFTVSGKLEANSTSWNTEVLNNISADVSVDPKRVLAHLNRAEFKNYPILGWADVDLKSNQLKGAFSGLTDELGPILAAYNLNDWRIKGTPEIVLSGTPTQPQIGAGFSGFVTYIPKGQDPYKLGYLDLRANFVDGEITINRGVIAGEYGVARIGGNISDFGKKLNIEIEGGDLNLTTLDPRIDGLAFFSGQVKGSIDDPLLAGKISIFDAGFEDYRFPQGQSDVTFHKGVLALKNTSMQLGLGKVSGEGEFNTESQKLFFAGTGQDIFLSDYTTLPVFGRVNIEAFAISGPVENLSAEFMASGNSLLAYEVPIEAASIRGEWKQGEVILSDVTAEVGGGILSASGKFDPATAKGSLKGEATSISLTALPLDRGAIDVQGIVSGNFAYENTSETENSGHFDGNIDALSVNGFDVGPGGFNAQLINNRATFSASAGSPQGFIELENGAFNVETKEYGVRVIASGLEVQDLYRAVKNKLPEYGDRVDSLLATANGTITLEATAIGDPNGVQIGAEYLDASGLSLNGKTLGKLRAIGKATQDNVELTSLLWDTEHGEISASGNWQKDGSIAGQLELQKVDAQILRAIFIEFPEWHANINSKFEVFGKAENPTAIGTINIDQVINPNGKEIPVVLKDASVNLANQIVNLESTLAYKDLKSTVSAEVPLAALEEGNPEMMSFDMNIEEVELKDLGEFVEPLDLNESFGKVNGTIRLTGNTVSRNVNGAIAFGPDSTGKSSLKFKEVNTAFQDVSIIIDGRGSDIGLSAQAFSIYGGYVSADATANISDFLYSQTPNPATQQIPIKGSIDFEEFRLRQKVAFPNPNINGKSLVAEKPSEATIYGNINISGTAAIPVISGNVELEAVDIHLPPEFPEGQESSISAFDPRFDNLKITAGKKSRLNLSLGNLDLNGTAAINGPLSQVQLSAPMELEGGTFNLPTTRVRLQEGGTVKVQFGAGAAGNRIDLNLEGKTRVTVRQTDTRYESYELLLAIKGNLLEENGVQLSGTSDPPDLSQDRIRAIIGQQDLLETLASTVFGENKQSALTEGIYSLAVPSLTQGITENLAKALRLDYLVFDYNPFDLGVIRGGIDLGKGLFLEGSRQLTATEFGRIKYDLQLSYRVPSRNRILNRTRFFLGADETVPWRFGFDYSIRF